MEKSFRNLGAYEITQKCTGPETGSPRKCLGPERLAGSSQEPPILLIGDPIGDQGQRDVENKRMQKPPKDYFLRYTGVIFLVWALGSF
ncbi:unnamed protein product [Haemonchus placei]|uniref:Uncharacterized protein n=1 Tax=Haemonchus placei TaxID=6290 RepID=A0A0N4XAQ7_HAEPC|nr:unnamed protein product [Haemonchus placei]